MSTLSQYSQLSGKAAVLQLAFGDGWKDMVREIVWELVDQLCARVDEAGTLFTVQKWFISIPIKGVYVEWAAITLATRLVGPKP